MDVAVRVSLCVSHCVEAIEADDDHLSTAKLEEHRKQILSVLASIPSSYTNTDLETVAAQIYLSHCLARKPNTVFVNTFLQDEVHDFRNIGAKQSLKAKKVVILYSNTVGTLCGAVAKKYRGKNVCIAFDFSLAPTQELRGSSLDFRLTSYGYGGCRFVIPLDSTSIFRSDIPAAVSSCITRTLDIFTESITLSMSTIRLHPAYIHRLAYDASPTVTTEKELPAPKPISPALHLGPMNIICRLCFAVSFKGKPKSLCCNAGVNIVPEQVLSLKRDDTLNWLWVEARSNEKLYYMFRALNNLVAFVGLSMNMRQFPTGFGQLPLVVQGTVDVGICHLNPDSAIASFAQLYICDDYKSRHSLNETMSEWKMKIDYELVEKIITILRKDNVIARAYQSIYEVYLAEANALRIKDEDVLPQILMNLKHKRELPDTVSSNTHEARLNVPKVDNVVAAIYVCRNGVFPTEDELDKGLRVYSRGGQSIAAYHNNNIDAMSYPLYFPKGEQSFVRESLPKLTRKRTAPVDITADESHQTDLFFSDDQDKNDQTDSPSPKIEADLLSAIGRNTTQIRGTKATTLYTYLDQQLQDKGFKLGKFINLPRYFVGSTLWYDQLYHNAMAVAQRLGKPDLFITFTGNQDWPEIRENLVTRFDSWITDPLLCARVFRLRLQSFIKEIVDKKVFGEVLPLQ
ncbi:unnamed protein product [Cylicocyclus nassatus]|uniref:Helitron helicase-like domain-containing protein n=1 Tax=Cylicocyclus nassatus TaxID=53992 RepID=A0AA36GFW9_CYLNA|nr:unnamed protein product [Cylicocyclus nassatus]